MNDKLKTFLAAYGAFTIIVRITAKIVDNKIAAIEADSLKKQ